jgi:hypothetical protein
MFIYNVTIKVSEPIAASWLQWMQDEHIPEVIETGCFTHCTLVQLLEIDDSEGPTYAAMYHAESKALYNRYIEKFAANLREKGFQKWGNQFIAFRSLMKVIN